MSTHQFYELLTRVHRRRTCVSACRTSVHMVPPTSQTLKCMRMPAGPTEHRERAYIHPECSICREVSAMRAHDTRARVGVAVGVVNDCYIHTYTYLVRPVSYVDLTVIPVCVCAMLMLMLSTVSTTPAINVPHCAARARIHQEATCGCGHDAVTRVLRHASAETICAFTQHTHVHNIYSTSECSVRHALLHVQPCVARRCARCALIVWRVFIGF